ncbi:hypothetical protein AAHA92_22246 [Salvia divinorum]|uniref:Myb/SANT-like domain-containing protein n=1 Tax=Salvia divinorum TaxID=28513 RepID=A0ABD1GRL3_SALDI
MSGFTIQGSNDCVRPKYRKGDRTRRMWSEREEDILAASLLELVARGWKSDNSFRAGYLKRIEDSLRKEFPATDLKGTPHINSKISSWKKSFNSLQLILTRTGVGFNSHRDYKIDCNDEQWEQIVAADSNAKFMRNKSWPLWDQWNVIFGKDRATGDTAEDIPDGARAVRTQNEVHTHDPGNDYHVSFDDFFEEENNPPLPTPDNHHEESTGQSEQHAVRPKQCGKKRKTSSTDAVLMEFLRNLHVETNKRLEVISSRIGYEFDLGKARQEVFDKLGGVVGLTIEQRYDLCDILGDKSQRLEIFIGMPAEARPGYVLRLLEQNQKPN